MSCLDFVSIGHTSTQKNTCQTIIDNLGLVLGVYIKEFRERLYLREGSGQSVTLYVLLFRGPGIELLAEKQNLAELSGVEFKNTLKKTTVDMKWVAVT